MGLIRRLSVEEVVGTELTNKLTENLKEILSDNKVIVIRFEAGNGLGGLRYEQCGSCDAFVVFCLQDIFTSLTAACQRFPLWKHYGLK